MPDRSVFDRLCRHYRSPVVAVAREIFGDDDEAEDVAQRLLLRLWRTGSWRSIERPGPFLRTAAHNEALSLLRARRRWNAFSEVDAEDLVDPAPSVEGEVLEEEREELLLELLARLPERCAKTCALVYVGGFTHREVAEILEVSVGTVEKHVARGLRRLKAELLATPGGRAWLSTFEDRGGVMRSCLRRRDRGDGSS